MDRPGLAVPEVYRASAPATEEHAAETGGYEAGGYGGHHDEAAVPRMGNRSTNDVAVPRGSVPAPVEVQNQSLKPGLTNIVQAGAFGAVLGGMSAGVAELARVKQGEISSDEAVRNVMKSSAQGAATMAVASFAGQVVRSHPVVGVIVLAAAGIGALTALSKASAKRPAAPPQVSTPAVKAPKKPRASGGTPSSA